MPEYEVTAEDAGCTFHQTFTDPAAAMECREQLLEQGWAVVVIEPVHGEPARQSQ
jgi:hypothetical protein